MKHSFRQDFERLALAECFEAPPRLSLFCFCGTAHGRLQILNFWFRIPVSFVSCAPKMFYGHFNKRESLLRLSPLLRVLVGNRAIYKSLGCDSQPKW